MTRRRFRLLSGGVFIGCHKTFSVSPLPPNLVYEVNMSHVCTSRDTIPHVCTSTILSLNMYKFRGSRSDWSMVSIGQKASESRRFERRND